MFELSNQSEIQKRISKKIKKYNGYMFLDATEPVKDLREYIGKEMETITVDDLAIVHITKLFPNGTILSNKDGKKIFEGIDNGKKYKFCHQRITVHCTLNGLVQGNSGGNWDGYPFIVIDKLNKHLNQFVNIFGGDTYTNCSLNLSDDAVYLIEKDYIDSIPSEQLQNKNIIVFEGDRNIVVNEILILMGYKPQNIDGWGWNKILNSSGRQHGEMETTLTQKFVQNYISDNPNVTNMPHTYDMYRRVEQNIKNRDEFLSECRNGELVDSRDNLYPNLNEVIDFYLEFYRERENESFDEFCSRYFIRYDAEKSQIFYLNSSDCYKNAHFDKKELKVKFNKIDVLNTLIQNSTNIDDCYILFKAFNQNKEMIISRVKTILQTLDLATCLEKIRNFKDYEQELLSSIKEKISLLSLNEYQILKTQYPIYSSFFDNSFRNSSKISFHNIDFNINSDGELAFNDKRISDANYDKLVQYLSQIYVEKFYLTKDGRIRIRNLTENNVIINELNSIVKNFLLNNYDIFKDNNIISENEFFDTFKGYLDNSLEQLKNNMISLNLFEDILLNCKLIEKSKNTKLDLYEILNSFIKVAINNPTPNNIQTIKFILQKYSFDTNLDINIYNIVNNDLELSNNEQDINSKQTQIKRINELKNNITMINQLEQEMGLSTQMIESEITNKFGK